MFKRIDTVFLKVRNIDESIKWYTEVLGFTLRWKSGSYAALNVSETPLTIYENNTNDFKSVEEVTFNFFVENIDEVYNYLINNNVIVEELHKENDGVKWFNFKDIDGNVIGVCNF